MKDDDRTAPAGEPADLPTDATPVPPTDATPVWSGVSWSGSTPALPQGVVPPPVAWAAPPTTPVPAPGIPQFDGDPPPFTVGALLSDTFARYGADPVRLFLISLGPAVLSYTIAFLAPATVLSPAAIGLSFLLSLLSVVVTFVGTAALYALAEGGRAISLAGALRRGLARSGWLFLTLLVTGLAGLLAILVVAIPAIILIATRSLAALGAIVFFVGFLVLGWAALRVSLAVPAVVVGNLTTIEALSRSWKITRPAGVWLRIFASALVIGLLVSPAGIVAGLLIFTNLLPTPALLVLASFIVAFVTPVSTLVLYSAYRRLVPTPASTPLGSPAGWTPPAAAPALDGAAPAVAWSAPPPVPNVLTSAPAPDGPSPAPEAPLAPTVPWAPPATTAGSDAAAPPGRRFVAPRMATSGMAILVLTLLLGIGGLASIPFAIGSFFAGGLNLPGGGGFPGFPNASGFPVFPASGNVARGTVAFGTSSSLAICTVEDQTTFAPTGGELVWMASLTRRVTFSDEVRLRITVDGTEVTNVVQDPAIYECLGTEEPETGIEPGVYVFDVLLNGRVDATGTLFVN